MLFDYDLEKHEINLFWKKKVELRICQGGNTGFY